MTIKDLSPKAQKMRKNMLNHYMFNMFMLIKLPIGLFAGLRVKKLETDKCEVTIPFGWRSQNPFQSIYFAVLAMGAELSAGAIALLAVENSGVEVSTLPIKLEAVFTKKAISLTTFTCENGQEIFDAIALTSKTGEPVTVNITSIGRLNDGAEVAKFTILWSFKRKSKK